MVSDKQKQSQMVRLPGCQKKTQKNGKVKYRSTQCQSTSMEMKKLCILLATWQAHLSQTKNFTSTFKKGCDHALMQPKWMSVAS